MTIKDSFDTAGVVSTWGTTGRASHIPELDATVVARLRNAGAILLGKTNTPEFTLGHETDNLIYGRTNNPYDPSYSPGGSSGGAAAIVAAGGAPFDIGSDTGGSIRNPAHFCGLAGIKPTTGRVPRTGHAIGPGGLLDTLTQIGPLARTVGDVAFVLRLISGPDGRDPFVAPVDLLEPANVDLASLRGIFYKDNGIESPAPEVQWCVQAAVESLQAAGVRLAEQRPPGIEETIEIYPLLFRGWDGGAWGRSLLAMAGTAEDETTLGSYLQAPAASPAEFLGLIERWDSFRLRMLDFVQDQDVIIAPVNALAALPHGTWRQHYRGFSYTMTYNLTGWPAAVIRVGATAEGLPLGVQIVGKPWREDIVLAVAGYLESAFGGWQPPPALA
jgi:amidase